MQMRATSSTNAQLTAGCYIVTLPFVCFARVPVIWQLVLRTCLVNV
jgi:hypothetical protein